MTFGVAQVVGEVDAVDQRMVFGLAVGVVQPDDHRDACRPCVAGNPQPLTPLRKWIALAGMPHGSSTDFGIFGGDGAEVAVQHDRRFARGRPADRSGRTERRRTSLTPQSSKTSRSTSESGRLKHPARRWKRWRRGAYRAARTGCAASGIPARREIWSAKVASRILRA